MSTSGKIPKKPSLRSNNFPTGKFPKTGGRTRQTDRHDSSRLLTMPICQVEVEIPQYTQSLTGFVQREKFLGLEYLAADRSSLAGRRVQVVDAHAAGSRADGDLKSGDEFRFLPLFNVPRKNRAEFRINASIRGERPRHARARARSIFQIQGTAAARRPTSPQ